MPDPAPQPTGPSVLLGVEIRQLRKARGMTLADLAGTSGLSISFLSKVERDLARPSLTALQDIAESLDVAVGWFFESDAPAPAGERPYVVRSGRRRRLTYSELASTDYLGFEDHLLSASLDGDLALGISRYEAGGTTGDDLQSHEGEEAGLVMSGTMSLTIEDRLFELGPGDSFSFPSHLPHRYENRSNAEVVIVWANTPVSLRHK